MEQKTTFTIEDIQDTSRIMSTKQFNAWVFGEVKRGMIDLETFLEFAELTQTDSPWHLEHGLVLGTSAALVLQHTLSAVLLGAALLNK